MTMNSYKIHDQDYFFKYLDFDGAIKTLEDGTFMYSSPSRFNDPFDMQFDLMKPGLSNADMAEIIVRKVVEFKFDGKPLPSTLQFEGIQELPDYIKRVIKISPERKAEYVAETKQTLEANLDAMREFSQIIMKHVDNLFIKCVTTRHDSILMWSHYARNHTGLVIKIKCVENPPNALCGARKVVYENNFPIIGTRDEWIQHLEHGTPMNTNQMLETVMTRKSEDWKYEEEWRIPVVLKDFKGHDRAFVKFDPNEIEAVYLGCRMKEPEQDAITHLLRASYPEVEIYKARKNESSFSLEFDRINSNP